MKKLYIFLFFLLIILMGCSKRDFEKIINPDYEIEYLSNVKSMQLDGKGGLNNVNDLIDNLLYQHLINTGEVDGFDRNSIKWEINGETKDGVMILITYKNAKVYLPIIEDGDYIKANLPETIFQSPNATHELNQLYNQYLNR